MAFPGSLWKGIKVFVLFSILIPWLVWIVAFHESLHYYSCYQGVEQNQFGGLWLLLKNIVGKPCYLLFVEGVGMVGFVELNIFPKHFNWSSTGKTKCADGLSSWSVHFLCYTWLHIVFKCATVRSATLLNVRNLVWKDGWVLLGLWNVIYDTAELLAVCSPN